MPESATLFRYAVYTTLAAARFEQAVSSGSLAFTERKRWTTAVEILQEARAEGQRVAVLVSDGAHDCSNLVGWALLDTVRLADQSTHIVASVPQRLRGHRTQELILRNSGLSIAPYFIRPYALVHTPAFLHGAHRAVVVRQPIREPTTLFSFGYEGCGAGTRRLVAAVDEVERQRGFEPPPWVDARVSRSVRAVGFRDKAFQELLGEMRYAWMRDLGNERVHEGRRGIQIRRPEAVSELLQRAVDEPRRRVIFFCSCSGSFAGCHRHEVGRLLLRHAKKVGARVRRVEWPGGDPITMTFDVPSVSDLDRKTVELGGLRESEAAAVPWGSHGILRAAKGRAQHVLLGPPLFGKKHTTLRVVQNLGPALPGGITSVARRWRRAHGVDAQAAG